jgi:ribosomal-protein-alanine N-acetyltransferase
MTLPDNDARIETERLVLRRITEDDLPFFARIHVLPEVAQYLAHGRPRLIDETRAWMASLLESYRAIGLGQVAVTRKEDGALLGRCGLSRLESEPDPQPDGTRLGYYFPSRAPAGITAVVESELGYTFDPAAWGKGYAREAVNAVWRYHRERNPGDRVVSLIHPENTKSIRLASRFGVSLVDRITSWDRPFDRYLWPTQPVTP